jgi:hypothetical protein
VSTFSELIYSSLADNLGSPSVDVYPLIARDSAPLPYVVYSQIANPINNSLTGRADLQNTRLQIDCWHSSYSAVHTLANAVIAAMDAQTHSGSPAVFTAILIGKQDFEDPDTRDYRVVLEFSVWHY